MTGVHVWSRVRLAEVADVASGAGFPTAYQGEKEGDFPFYKVSDMNLPGNEVHMRSHNNAISEEVRKKLRAKPFPAGSVIFPKIGAAIATNKKRVLTRPSCADNNVMAVIPREGVLLPEFLLYLFSRKNLSDFASDSNPPSIRKTEVEDWEISIPPIDEQRRIVDILNHATSIRRLREEARAKAREIIPALFVDMFGDPISNPKKWATSPLGRQVAEFRYGTSVKCVDQPMEGALPILRIPNIIGGQVHWDDLKFTVLDVKERGRLLLQPDDLLFVRTNGNPDYIGRCAVYSGDRQAAYASYLIRARLSPMAGVIPRYVQELVSYPTYRQNLIRNAKTTAGNFNISIDGLERLDLMLPPLPLQQEFAERVAEVEGISSLNDRAATAAEQMAQSLLAQVFGQAA